MGGIATAALQEVDRQLQAEKSESFDVRNTSRRSISARYRTRKQLIFLPFWKMSEW